MTIAGVQAWVTSAVEDKVVNKAIVLAGSLRRVHTAKKLAVLTTLAVSKDLREKLKEAFDLVVFLEQETPNGLNLEDYAKVQSFSLLIFNKCVYLSPDALVLKNCDEIFEKYETFAACENDKKIDPTVYLFQPSLDHGRALEKIVHYMDSAGERTRGDFSKYFNVWVKNHIPKTGKLESKYNLKIKLESNDIKSMKVDVNIANFTDVHPIGLTEESLRKKLNQVGPVEKFAMERCMEIYLECVKTPMAKELAPFSLNQCENEPIAIVGMSFRLPGGNNVDEFWDLMIKGKEAIQVLPPSRWKKEQLSRQCNNREIEAGFLNVPIDEFDSKFFGISPKEAEFLDPQQRLLHEVAWEAMEDAMIDPHTLRGTQTGVFVGSWIHDYRDISLKSSDVDFFRVYMGNSIASESARLSHFFETTGPSIATESGCSSAIVAVHMACKSLQKHESKLALACGVNLLVNPFDKDTLSFVLAPDGRCKTFDSKADGFGRAEACAVLLMKRLSDAVKDGDDIWGLVRGSAVTQEGVSKSLGTPTIHCESLAMELALKDSGVHPAEVSYIEAHGTGTSVGDPLEVAAITKAYSNGRIEPVVIGSVKTNVGHTESASGITGIIKVLLAMKNEKIPPHRNLDILNPAINLDAIPAEIPMSAKAWPRRENRPRIAGVSSFGISGTDGHAIIQEPPVIYAPQIDYKLKRPLQLLKISAKSPESMDELLAQYEKICTEKAVKNDETEFANLAYSANTGRATFNHRAVIVAKDFIQAAKIFKDKSFKLADVQGSGNQLCLLFTGQGSQYPNMAASLYATSPIFRDHFDKCDEVLATRYGINMREALWGKSTDELSRTLYSQTSIFCVEYCLLKLWESWGVKADYVLGHSLGEFAAAVAAGALDFEDALMLVAERSRLIDSLPRGKMLVIKADKKTVDQNIAKFKEVNPKFWVDYAALNSPDQTVVAGEGTLIEEFAKYCGDKSLKTIVLAATHAFHSRHMDPMLEAYRKVAKTVKTPELGEDAPKYISGMEGKLLDTKSIDSDYWVRHTREKVSFMDACKVAQSEGCSLFLEVGPHPVLSALAMMNIEGQTVTCLPSIRRKEEEWVTMLDSLTKLYMSDWKGEINWKGFDRYYKRSRAPLPFYPFNRKPVWINFRYLPGVLHPLLGKLLPNASGRSVFESQLTFKNTSFVQDHVIGNTVVFPGAGFLEMCLSGGYSSVQGLTDEFCLPKRPMLLKGLKIKSPLAFYESQFPVLQTIVSLEESDQDEMGYSVSIYRHDNSDSSAGGQWIPHASAKFLPVVPTLASHISTKIDIPGIQSSWQRSDAKDFYEKLPEVGLRFGPKFQSLETSWKSDAGILLRVKVPDDQSSYLIHPVVADAMIQAEMLWTSKENIKKKLQVPVHIEEFVWLDSTNFSDIYIFCSNTPQGKCYAVLLNESGTPLAYMGTVDFAETTVKLVEGMIQQQATAMPQLWEEIWRNVPGPQQNRLDLDDLSAFKIFSPENREKIKKMDELTAEESSFYKSICHFTSLFFLDALHKLGWRPEVGKWFSADELMKSLGILDSFSYYSRFFLKSLAGYDVLEMTPGSGQNHNFRAAKRPPTSEEIEQFMKTTVTPYFTDRVEHRIIKEIGENLPKILTGTEQSLSYLFPDDPKKPNAEKFYVQMGVWNKPIIREVWRMSVLPYLAQAYKQAKDKKPGEKVVCRVLEIGAGTGSFPELFMEMLDEFNVEFEYYYTDISAAFFTQAEKLLEKRLKHIIFKKFNMEEDPLQQGFVPEYFDVISGVEVLHVAKDLKQALHNLQSLLKPNGILQIVETVQQDPRITFIFGLLDGYWQFKDFDLRPDHATLTIPKWKETFNSAGLSDVVGVPLYENVHGLLYGFSSKGSQLERAPLKYMGEEKHSWVIFSDDTPVTSLIEAHLRSMNRKVIVLSRRSNSMTEELVEEQVSNVMTEAMKDKLEFEGILYMWALSSDVKDKEQSNISLPFVNVCQHLSKFENRTPRVYIVTQGVHGIEDSEVMNPSPATVAAIARAVSNEDTHLSFIHLDLSPGEDPTKQIDEIVSNLWIASDTTVAFRNGKRLCSRLVAAKTSNDCISIPNGCDRFQLQLPKSRMISDLEFGYLNPYSIGDYEIEIQTKAMALNFRDVFTVIKPIAEFEDLNSVGLDFAGVVVKVGSKVTRRKIGDRVIGMNMHRNLSLPSHVKLEEQFLIPIPETMTFAEGVSLPAVFFTVVHTLVDVAKMKHGDILLLHTASGGVGLAAIQIAKLVGGVTVIATAGSKRKRNYLHNLGIQHVFHSRTTDFSAQVLEATNGRGVDIVLNSITGEGFKEASLAALAKNGRFIEMSKLNIWTVEEVKMLRPDVFYRVVDLTALERDEYVQLIETMAQYLKMDLIKPIAYETFEALNIRGALSYLQKAKHIGKIVCLMPELKVENCKIIAHTPFFHEDSTYLITGGLGGIGLEVAKYMMKNGAKHIAIVSRSQPKPEIANMIDSWNKAGKHVKAFSVDIGNFEQCRNLFNELKSESLGFPQLRGVMHAAGVLRDATIRNQTWDTFRFTYNPKVEGTWNLHELTKDLVLEHFVMFSSLASVLGSPGQTNHSASNSFEDAFAHYRRSIGLPAISINWGNWGEVGVATEVDLPGIRPISTTQGLLALEMFLKTQRSHIIVLNSESFALTIKLFPQLKKFIDDKRLLGEAKAAILINSDEFWTKMDSVQSKEEKLEQFKFFIKVTVKGILKMDGDEEVEDNADFQTLGIDSLMMLEMKNSLQNVLGSRMTLTAGQLKDCTNTLALALKLVDILEGKEEDSRELPTLQELQQLVREDSILPKHICACEGMPVKDISKVENILLTGVTGVLGPYLLRELSHRPAIKNIYCLIRKSGKVSPLERLTKRLQLINLEHEVNMSKVRCIQGDVADDKFGLSENEYDLLATNVDAIVHSAVRSDHTAKYWKSPETHKADVRNVNVKGTQRILQFSVHSTLKHVYYASTLLTVTSTDEDGSLLEDWQDVGAFDGLTFNAGYPISKHISEQLCKQAVERGIPCKTFRLPAIGGDSKTGRCDYLSNHIILRWLSYLKLKCMPDMPIPLLIMPVDVCAQVSLDMFFNPRATPDVYNIAHVNAGIDQTIIAVAEDLGIDIETMSFADFVKKLKLERDDSPLAPFRKMYDDEQALIVENFDGNPALKCLQKYLEDSTNFFRSRKLPQLIGYCDTFEPTEVVMRRDIQFLKTSGVFDKFGIK